VAWEHFEHEADMGIRGIGDSKAEAFEQAAIALTAVITSPENVRAVHQVHITCEAPDDELLFVEWLNALIYEMSTRNMIFGRFRVTLLPGRIDAHVWGESVDVKRHQPAVEIKGATYTALAVRETPQGGWMAQCVVDV
jgi:tRNA nucleotidyltransferase (CCA-adding enzyme)